MILKGSIDMVTEVENYRISKGDNDLEFYGLLHLIPNYATKPYVYHRHDQICPS